MDDMRQNQIAADVVYLARCSVNREIPDRARVQKMDLQQIYDFAASHMLSAAVAFALESAGAKDARSRNAIAAALRKTAIFDAEWSAIRAELEKAGIWYMPLKGAVLKGMYPRYGMREFADHDILFDASRAEDVKAIMEGRGYDAEYFGVGNHDCYYKKPALNFEMHRALFGLSRMEKLQAYYQHVQERFIGDGYEKRFSPEDFYLYMIAHEYKHYVNGGRAFGLCWIRMSTFPLRIWTWITSRGKRPDWALPILRPPTVRWRGICSPVKN